MTHSIKINLNLMYNHSKIRQIKVSLSVLCVLGCPGVIRLTQTHPSTNPIGVIMTNKPKITLASLPGWAGAKFPSIKERHQSPLLFVPQREISCLRGFPPSMNQPSLISYREYSSNLGHGGKLGS